MADETPAPLSDNAVRAEDVAWPQDIWRQYVRELKMTLADRDARLAALERENAAMRDIVAVVADKEPLAPDDDAGHWVTCLVGPCDPQSSDDTYVHAPECLITRARALLATPPADAAQQP